MKVVVTGSHGMIGAAVVDALAAEGHEVVRLVRGSPGPGEVLWDPASGALEVERLGGVEAAVHLAGAPIADRRWTDARKQEILNSRVRSTALLSERLAELDPHPTVLLSGSAIGFYGVRGEEVLDEDSAGGTGYLADVVRAWEAATAPAERAGIRVVHLRTGIVQSPKGGALKRQLPLFKLGLGGKLASGRQYLSWIALDDEVRAIAHLLRSDVRGPVNLTSPEPVTSAEFAQTLGRVLGRPARFAVPRLALAAVMGSEVADEMLAGGVRTLPTRLVASGFTFSYPGLEGALRHLLDRGRP